MKDNLLNHHLHRKEIFKRRRRNKRRRSKKSKDQESVKGKGQDQFNTEKNVIILPNRNEVDIKVKRRNKSQIENRKKTRSKKSKKDKRNKNIKNVKVIQIHLQIDLNYF